MYHIPLFDHHNKKIDKRQPLNHLAHHSYFSHGKFYADQLHEPLQSFHLKNMMSYYHADEYQRILREMLTSTSVVNEDDCDSVAMAKIIIFGASVGNKGSYLSLAQFKAEAHIISSAQAIHSLCDILAFIIYFAFRLDSYANPPAENRINLHSINKVLTNNSLYTLTQKSLDDILTSFEFEYLVAYINTSKHKSLVPSSLFASFRANQKSGMRIKKFSYKDFQGNLKHFDHKPSQDFLLVDNENLKNKLLKVGNTLNYYLK